jgi:methylamine--corrinoid protein Co-methyltransferase
VAIVRWDIWRRIETGPMCSEKEFTLRRYWPKVKQLAREYEIQFDANSIVPTDDTLIDDVYQAGLDLLLDVGIQCADTSRIIKMEESEIKQTLRHLPSEGTLGEGKDAVTLRHRGIEDQRPPGNIGGPTGVPLSEQMARKIYQSYAQEPTLDVLFVGAPKDVEGLTVRVNSPLEAHAEICNIAWARSSARKVGRPGMPIYGSCLPSLATDLNASQEYGYRKTDLRALWPLPHLRVDFVTLTRALHFAEYGCHCSTTGSALMGGLAGGPETSVITTIAECLATAVLFQPLVTATVATNTSYSPYVTDSDRESLWVGNLGVAAFTRNTHLLMGGSGCYTFAGPCTEMCLREIAAESIGLVSVGASNGYGPATTSGLQLDHCTGMESRFRGEVCDAVAGMKRQDANEIVKTLSAKYEDIIKAKKPPFGKRFEECYDTETITPSKEYLEIYEKVRKELEELGVQFKH